MKSCWIFGGAPFDGELALPENAFIIAADSGYNTVKRMGFTPNITLGDFDSLGCKPDRTYC
ncbi:MAG: thiamine diphosphokinase, partial [Ruminococcus sp.]|nr:thiamine diphosphokinase [Ruminococcus sp.]